MPIFSKKFDIKNIPQRSKRDGNCSHVQEKLDDFQTIQLNLMNKKKLKFADGKWIVSQIHGADADDVIVLRKKLQKLEEENNLNQIKVDVLLDMLTENLNELKILRNK